MKTIQLFVLTGVLVSGCSDDKPQVRPISQEPEILQPAPKLEPKWVEVTDEQLRALNGNKLPVLTQTNAQLRRLLMSCRTKIQRRLRQSNHTAFEWIVLDEYAPDVYVATAQNPSDFESIDDRIKKFRQHQNQVPTMLNLRFPVLRIRDSLSGPQKEVGSESCSIDTQFRLL